MAVSTYKHGVTWRDVPTSIVAPITADSGIPVAIGAAPSYLSLDPAPVNTPRMYYTYAQAVAEMGFSYAFHRYPLSAVIYNYFALFNTGPIILSNAFDYMKFLGEPVEDSPFTLNNNVIDTGVPDVVLSTVSVSSQDGETEYVRGTDYIASHNVNVFGVESFMITRIPSGAIPAPNSQILVSYTVTDASKVTRETIIGGVDPETGAGTGLEVIEDVFPLLAVVPGIILVPGWSRDPEIAAVAAAKASNINGCFKCVTYVDIDSTTIIKPLDVYSWKQDNNYVDNRLVAFWPRVGIDEKDFWLSIQAAALTQVVDNSNGDVPIESPSNKSLKINKTLVGPLANPKVVSFGKSYGDMLNGQGIVSAVNWIGGWKLWGNNTSIYPSNSDPKDRWIPVRRMTDWVGNTIVLTIYQKVDKPGNRRLIDAVVDSLNIWLNSLVSSGNAYGARVEFRQLENSDTDLLNGHYTFHIFQAFPTPAEWMEFLLEFDVSYLDTLFNPQVAQSA